MKLAGKDSVAALSVVSTMPGQRPEPPPELTESQAETWRLIVSRKTPDFFGSDCFHLLVALCKSIDLHRLLSTQIEDFDLSTLCDRECLSRYKDLVLLQKEQARLMAGLSTKMRLTQQARYQNSTAATKHNRAGKEGQPWEFGKR